MQSVELYVVVSWYDGAWVSQILQK